MTVCGTFHVEACTAAKFAPSPLTGEGRGEGDSGCVRLVPRVAGGLVDDDRTVAAQEPFEDVIVDFHTQPGPCRHGDVAFYLVEDRVGQVLSDRVCKSTVTSVIFIGGSCWLSGLFFSFFAI